MPGRAETAPSVCSGTRAEPLRAEYGYISITEKEGIEPFSIFLSTAPLVCFSAAIWQRRARL